MSIIGELGSAAGKNLFSVLKKKNPLLSENDILDQIAKFGAELFSPARAEGATLDLGKGQFLTPGQDRGFAMATIPNPVDKSNVVKNIQDLIEYAKKPNVMGRLKEGDKLGTWNSEDMGGLVVDPIATHRTKLGSLLSGKSTDQLGGFNLKKGEVYDVNNANINKERAKWIAGIAGTIVAANAVNPQEQAQGANLPAELLGAFVEKGVKKSALTDTIGEFGSMIKNTLKQINPKIFNDLTLSHINDNDTQQVAARKAYEVLLPSMKGYTEQPTEALVKNVNKNIKVKKPVVNIIDDVEDVLSRNNITATDKKYNVSGKTITTTDDYKKLGLKKPKLNPQELNSAIKKGDIAAVQKDIPIYIHNLEKFVNFDDVKNIIDNFNGESPFYVLKNFRDMFTAGTTETPNLLNELSTALGSSASPPLQELNKGSAINVFSGIKDVLSPTDARVMTAADWFRINKDAINPVTNEKYTAPQLNALRDKQLKEGLVLKNIPDTNMIPTGEVNIPYNARQNVIKDPTLLLNNPTADVKKGGIAGVKDKIDSYNLSGSNPLNRESRSVIDSWMVRAMFGNSNLSTLSDREAYDLADSVVSHLADKYGISKNAMQDIIWHNARISAGEGKGVAFTGLENANLLSPFTNQNTMDETLDIRNLSRQPSVENENATFINNLLTALDKNPALADKLEISGGDIRLK